MLDPLDSVESHAHDTMVAGDFLCDQAVVDLVCREGANAVLDLVAMVRAARSLSLSPLEPPSPTQRGKAAATSAQSVYDACYDRRGGAGGRSGQRVC